MDGAKQCVKQHKNSTIDCIKWQIEPQKRMCIKPHKYNHALPAPSGRAWLRATNFRFSFPEFPVLFPDVLHEEVSTGKGEYLCGIDEY